MPGGPVSPGQRLRAVKVAAAGQDRVHDPGDLALLVRMDEQYRHAAAADDVIAVLGGVEPAGHAEDRQSRGHRLADLGLVSADLPAEDDGVQLAEADGGGGDLLAGAQAE